jgi:hypothetical protein
MGLVSGILCQILTSDIEDAGSDGTVYLGLGGREFHLDSEDDDFERGSAGEYFIGKLPIPGPNKFPIQQRQVLDGAKNDPRNGFPFHTDDLAITPVYIRFEPENFRTDDHWNLQFAAVFVYDTKFSVGYVTSRKFDYLWLGHKTGKILYLTNEFRDSEEDVLAQGRKLAAQRKK